MVEGGDTVRAELIQDADGEAFVFGNRWDTVIPLSFTVTEEHGLRMEIFPRIAPIGEIFLRRFSSSPCSRTALSWLSSRLSPEILTWGYKKDVFSPCYGRILRLRPIDGICEKSGNLSPFEIKSGDSFRNRTTYDLDATREAGCLAYGMEENGKIVSVAVTHDAPDSEAKARPVEVGVETIPRARGKGYATACLTALASALIREGFTVEYRCRMRNVRSFTVARHVGFREIGRYYYYVGRRVHDHGI